MRKALVRTGLAAAATAAAGSLGTDPRSRWYRRLRKPAWQPPAQAFPLVWTPLYALIAFGSARALTRGDGQEREAFGRALAGNLALNAGWPALFFRAKSPRLALAEIAVLNLSNVALIRRAMKADRTAGAALVPYAAWTLFATALNASIVRRNR
ncbi:TspO/MBR family protein [Nonomuraea sp. NPDC050783]|uniref:TspO/MBR family protein n=1 Tax=Nonomuraea sp. NPDC050783 TaxID=3154634 RepID=UPI003465919A